MSGRNKAKYELVGLELKNDIWEVKINGGQIFKSRFLIGADGAQSIVRKNNF